MITGLFAFHFCYVLVGHIPKKSLVGKNMFNLLHITATGDVHYGNSKTQKVITNYISAHAKLYLFFKDDPFFQADL